MHTLSLFLTLSLSRSLSLSLSHTHTTRFSCESHTCKAPAAMTCKILLIDDEQEG